MRLRLVLLAAVTLPAATLAAGCGDEPVPSRPAAPAEPSAKEPPEVERPERERPGIRRATCPPGAGNCAAATGRVVLVESVDPDGDGDLHLVLAGGGVTAPGITVLDVARDLRPRRDPRIGDLASGAGPVYRGSFGQRQIQVTVLRVARR